MAWLAAARVLTALAVAAPLSPRAPTAATLGAARPAAATPPAATTVAATTVDAGALIAQVQRGQPVDLVGATVHGTVELTVVGTIPVPFRCRNCAFDGDIAARDVIFKREVDLSGSTVAGGVDMAGAEFNQAALFEQATAGTVLRGPVDFSVATFSDRVSFDDALFGGRADFTAARFGAPANFTSANFSGDVSFADTVFADRFDCLGCAFHTMSTFARSELLKGATMVGALYVGGATFDYLSASGTIDFSHNHFLGDASFFGLNSSSEVDFTSDQFGHKPVFNSLSATDLRYDVSSVTRIDGEEHQRQILQLIEQGAKTRGDLSVANQAHFLHLRLASRHLRGFPRLWDLVVYRWSLGYLVRPVYPLLLLIALVTAVSLWRATRRPRVPQPAVDETPESESPPALPRKRLLARLDVGVTRFLDEVGRTIGWVFSLKLQAGDRTAVAWLEFLISKVLLAGIVLGVANSNATLRQLLDAVR